MQSTYLSRSLFGCTRISLISVAVLVGTMVLPAKGTAQQTGISQQSASIPESPGMAEHAGMPTSLRELIQEAEEKNPQIAASFHTWQASRNVPKQASALPETQFSVQQFSVGSPRPFAAQIKQVLGRSQESADIVAESLTVRSLPYAAAELLQRAREQNPDVHSKQASIRQQDTQVELAHKELRPDFNVGYTYEHTASQFKDYYMATFSVRLPNRGRQRAALAEAEQNRERARQELDAESQRVLTEVQQQYVRAKTSEERLKIYSDGLVPQSEATFQSALSAYQSNSQDFESLLSGFLDVLNLDLEYRNELVEHESALAELERLTGVDLP